MKIRDTEDLCELVRSDGPPLIVRAGGTKSVHSMRSAIETERARACDVSALTGISIYEPSEYTITAAAATPVREVDTALRAHRQYLPFDPLLVEAGATLGGTIAANAAGSGRFRHGGVRDFVLGIRFVDGLGYHGTQGARVVKNAAGLDVPKLMVGSLGTLGCLTEVTLKVFPAPVECRTVLTHQLDLQAADSLLHSLLRTSMEFLAVDLMSVEVGSQGSRWSLAVRIGGSAVALDRRSASLESWARARSVSEHDVETLTGDADASFWRRTRELKWIDDRHVAVKVPLTLSRFIEVEQLGVFSQFDRILSATQQLLLNVPRSELELVDQSLRQLGLNGQILRPSSAATSVPVLLGVSRGRALLDRVKQALDPQGRFAADVWTRGLFT